MTTDDEMAARGRVVTEHSEVKKQLALLVNEAVSRADRLRKLGDDLRHIQYDPFQAKEPELRELLDAERTILLLREIADLREKRSRLEATLKEMGLA